MKKLLALLLAIIMVAGVVAGCGGGGKDNTDGAGGTFVMASFFKGNLDVMSESCYDWTQNVYEQIIVRDTEGKLAPGVCNFELSEDSLTLTLTVREGVKFHDGSLVTIEDVKASFDRACLMRKTIKNTVGAYVDREATKIEGNKLIIKFTKFDVNTLYNLSNDKPWAVVMPKAVCDKYGQELITDVKDVIGTGPYKVIEAADDAKKITMIRFDDYVPVPAGRTGLAAPKKANFYKIIVVEQSANANSDYMLMADNQLHMVWADSELMEQYTAGGLVLTKALGDSVASFNFNCENGPTANANVRKAIAACIDYTFFVAMDANNVSNKNTWSPATGAYYTEKLATADYAGKANVELAKQYLQAAGYKGETIRMVTNGTYNYLEALVKPFFTAAGITLEIVPMEAGTYSDYVSSTTNDWHILWGTEPVVDLPNIPGRLVSGWDNQSYKDLYDEAVSYAVGTNESIAAWAEVDKLLAEECPFISISWAPSKLWAHNADLVLDREGRYEYIWNSYWKNPEAHK